MRQDDDDFVNGDINRALAKMRDISRKFPLDLHPNGVALPIAAAFIRSLPYVDKFLKRGEAFAAVLQKKNSFKGDLELVARSEQQSESFFLMQVRATNRAIAIVDGMWVEIADRLVRWPALSHELDQARASGDALKQELDATIAAKDATIAAQDAALAEAAADFDSAMDLTCAVFQNNLSDEQRKRVERALFFAEARALINKLEALDDRMNAIEATLPHPLPSPSPQPMSDLDGERSDAS
jgi:hypothetical protein